MLPRRRCVICGKRLELLSRSNQIYCSKECNQRAFRIRRREQGKTAASAGAKPPAEPPHEALGAQPVASSGAADALPAAHSQPRPAPTASTSLPTQHEVMGARRTDSKTPVSLHVPPPADPTAGRQPPESPVQTEELRRTPSARLAQEAPEVFATLAERVREVPAAVRYRIALAIKGKLVPTYLPEPGQPLPHLDGRVSDEPFRIQPEFELPFVAVAGWYAVQLLDRDGREVKLPRSLYRGVMLPKWPPEEAAALPTGSLPESSSGTPDGSTVGRKISP